jgi:hypothetical protein
LRHGENFELRIADFEFLISDLRAIVLFTCFPTIRNPKFEIRDV